jgi:hypothetical protein
MVLGNLAYIEKWQHQKAFWNQGNLEEESHQISFFTKVLTEMEVQLIQ